MAKERDKPANENEQLVQFRRRDAQRIANAVHAHETARRGRNPSRLPRAAGEGGEGGAADAGLVTATFLGSWLRTTGKIVSLDGENFSGTATAFVFNSLCDISAFGTQGLRVAIISPSPAKDGGYILVNYECR